MRFALTVCSLIFVAAFASFADELTSQPERADVTKEQLLQRVEQLEKRIASLEARLGRPYAPPKYLAQPQPIQPAPKVPQWTPAPPTPQPWRIMPPMQPDGNVPRSWQRFEFNGQYFYIIPVDEFGRNSTRSTPKPNAAP
jgi:hypothetical protein